VIDAAAPSSRAVRPAFPFAPVWGRWCAFCPCAPAFVVCLLPASSLLASVVAVGGLLVAGWGFGGGGCWSVLWGLCGVEGLGWWWLVGGGGGVGGWGVRVGGLGLVWGRGVGVVVGVFGLVGCWWGRGALWGVGGTCSACSACVASSTSSAGSLFSLPRFHAVDVASFTGSACSTGNTCNPRKGRFWIS